MVGSVEVSEVEGEVSEVVVVAVGMLSKGDTNIKSGHSLRDKFTHVVFSLA